METKKRERWMDGVKTIAIFIVLLNHAYMHIPGVNFWGGMFYVPVFFVLSGYTYHQKQETYWAYVKKKAKRLLMPYFAANLFLLLFFLMKEALLERRFQALRVESVLGIFYARNQLFRADCEDVLLVEMTHHINGGNNIYFLQLLNAPMWFLPGLFLSLILFALLMRVCKGDQRRIGFVTALSLLAQVLYHYLCPMLLPWSLDALPYFLFLIQLGYVLKAHHVFAHILEEHQQKTKICRAIAAGLFPVFILLALVNGSSNLSVADYGNYILFSLFNSIVSSFFVMLFVYWLEHGNKKDRLPLWLSAPGRHTMAIMCYHLFVFLFLDRGITVFASWTGLDLQSGLLKVMRFLMILVTMVLFTLLGNKMLQKREAK